MLYQQGLTELIHSTPSEQVAYLLVERASLLELNQDPGEMTSDGDQERTQAEPLNPSNSSVGKSAVPELFLMWRMGLNFVIRYKCDIYVTIMFLFVSVPEPAQGISELRSCLGPPKPIWAPPKKC